MPVFTPEYLEKAAYHIYVAKGTPAEEAKIVAAHQVKANLTGHDSHGVIHIPEYCERIDRGHIVPGAPFEVLSETPTTAVVDGHWGFGFVVTEKATRMAIDKAKENGVAAFTIRHQSHIGRLGDYPTICAQEGMIALLTADSGAGPKAVAPFGGRARRLGTNPICIGVPSNLPGQVLLDMATSAVAAGKISLARNRGEQVPTGWIVDKDGNPTNDPNDYASRRCDPASGRRSGTQGVRPVLHGGNVLRPADGSRFRHRPSGSSQRWLLPGRVRRVQVPPSGGLQTGDDRVCRVREDISAGSRFQRDLLPRRDRVPDRIAAARKRHFH